MKTVQTARKQQSNRLLSMTITAMLLALGLLIPPLTGLLPPVGKFFSPMHIPVLICGLTCGWRYGLSLGVTLPLLNSLIHHMPRFPDKAVPMVFELAVYGLLAGLIYEQLLRRGQRKNHLPALYTALLLAMIGGRLVGGAAKGVLFTLILPNQNGYTLATFLTMLYADYFVGTVVGAAIHLVLVPAVTMALETARLSPLARRYSGRSAEAVKEERA